MDDYVRPLVEEYERLDEQVKRAEAEIFDLRVHRDKLRRAVLSLAPEAIGEKAPKGKPSGRKTYGPSEETIGLVRRVLDSELNGDQFTATELERRFSQRLPAEGSLRAVLKVMHAQGELRLVKTGRGGSKTYEVIR